MWEGRFLKTSQQTPINYITSPRSQRQRKQDQSQEKIQAKKSIDQTTGFPNTQRIEITRWSQ